MAEPEITVEPKNNADPKPEVRCQECDRVTDNYITYVSPTNDQLNVCWECQNRDDKYFNVKPGWGRRSRRGYIPR